MNAEAARMPSRAKGAQARHCAYYLALVQRESKNWQRIESCYAQIKRAFDTAPDCESRVAFSVNLHFFQLRGRYLADMLEWANTCLDWAERTGRQDVAAKLYRYRGDALLHVRRFDQAIDALETALNLARRVEDQGEVNRTLHRIAVTYIRQARWDETLRVLDEILDGPDGAVNDMTARALGLRSNIRHNQQKWDGLVHDYERAYAIAESLGDVMSIAHLQLRRGQMCAAQGDWAEAERFYRKGLAASRAIGDRSIEAMNMVCLGAAAGEQGRNDEALTILRNVLREVRARNPNGYGEPTLLVEIGICLLRQGRIADAHRIFVAALERATRMTDPFQEPTVCVNLALTCRALYRDDEAEQLLFRALDLFRKIDDYQGMAAALVELGDLFFDRQEPEQATLYWQEAKKLVHPSSRYTKIIIERLEGSSSTGLLRGSKKPAFSEKAGFLHGEF